MENIPAEVCLHCGEATFSADNAEHVRQLVQSGKPPRVAIETVVYMSMLNMSPPYFPVSILLFVESRERFFT